MTAKRPRVLVALSGGVDSSVAALLLKNQGYDVIGATMQVWDYTSCNIDEGNGTCCSSIDVDDARSVCDKLGIPFYVLNCEAKFKTMVIEPFIQSYLKGETPVPCVHCNTFLKFDHLIQKMDELECDFLATGHYAQLIKNDKGETLISTSSDSFKDQTYFLFTLDKSLLPKLLFPVGHLTKPEVRVLAEENGLVRVAKKKDSTGICFVGSRPYTDFLKEHGDLSQVKGGEIRRYPSNELMGHHNGIHNFTYGQSKGLGLSHHEKLFVSKIDPESRTVWIAEEEHLYASELELTHLNFMSQIAEGEIIRVKIRAHHQGASAQIIKTDDSYHLRFSEKQRAITPGQAAVFYRNSELIGGGWIK